MTSRLALVATALFLSISLPARADYYASVLLPIATFAPLPGANGSVWVTELVARNVGTATVSFGYPEGCGALLCPEPWDEISLNVTKKIATNPGGQILFMFSSSPVNVFFNLRVRDLSRQSETWGTEIPVISADSGSAAPIQLLNVPVSTDFRTTLRIYDWISLDPHSFHVRVLGLYDDLLIAERVVTTAHENAGLTSATLNDIVPASGTSAVRIEIIPLSAESRFWAFASVTNNATQHVTAVTPSPSPVRLSTTAVQLRVAADAARLRPGASAPRSAELTYVSASARGTGRAAERQIR